MSIYEKLSRERKKMQAEGTMPEWFSTAGWSLFKKNYLFGTDTVKGQFERIASTAAKHLPEKYRELGNEKFFELLWEGILSAATPVLANTGTDRGLPVSCQGSYIGDSIRDIYDAKKQLAIHSKKGFGTSGYLGDIRSRGSEISVGGIAEGVLPVMQGLVADSAYVSQGSQRRGAFGGYLPMMHGDWDEIADFAFSQPDGVNVGWNLYDEDVAALNNKDKEISRRYGKSLKIKMTVGRGYFMFPDKANRHAPEAIKRSGKKIKASNLCTEIMLPSDEELNFVCVLSSLNLIHWDRIKANPEYIFWATVFLDCINSEFIEKARGVEGLEKSVKAAEEFRALGLGQMGWHSLLQSKLLTFGGFEAHMLNIEIAKLIDEQSLKASKWLAEILGEPKYCKGLGIRNATRTAIAPTKSTAAIMGGLSEGINPDASMVFNQVTPAGEVNRINPFLLKIMKERNKYTQKEVDRIAANGGSVQDCDWLTPHEREVFRNAFELNMHDHIRLCATRQKYICQGQSINLYFAGDAKPSYINSVHYKAFNNENILSLYYIYSTRLAAGLLPTCESCM